MSPRKLEYHHIEYKNTATPFCFKAPHCSALGWRAELPAMADGDEIARLRFNLEGGKANGHEDEMEMGWYCS